MVTTHRVPSERNVADYPTRQKRLKNLPENIMSKSSLKTVWKNATQGRRMARSDVLDGMKGRV